MGFVVKKVGTLPILGRVESRGSNLSTSEHHSSGPSTWPSDWPKVRPPKGENYSRIHRLLSDLNLSTVCQEALCPNIQECWSGGTATFMLMGDTCTRACRFCAVKTGNPQGILDEEEPVKLGRAVAKMGLSYVVLTSVDRDDLNDLGSSHFAACIRTLKREQHHLIVEALTPDFNALPEHVRRVAQSGVDVYAHNLETVERLTPQVRDRRSGHHQSLKTLELAKKFHPKGYTKSSLMLGLGEKESEVCATLKNLRQIGVDVVTFGQYLSPTARHKKYLPVHQYLPAKRFEDYRQMALEMGFLYVAAGPLVRSSYRAGEFFLQNVIAKEREGQTPLAQN